MLPALKPEELNAFRNLPVVQAALREDAAKTVSVREQLCDSRAALHRAAEEAWPRLTKAIDEAFAAFKAAGEPTSGPARLKVGQAVNARLQHSIAFDAKNNEIEYALRETASEAIEPFLKEMRDEQLKTPQSFDYIEKWEVINVVTGRRGRAVENNAVSIEARLKAIEAAILETEELRFQPDQSGVPARLEELRKGLPPIEFVRRGNVPK